MALVLSTIGQHGRYDRLHERATSLQQLAAAFIDAEACVRRLGSRALGSELALCMSLVQVRASFSIQVRYASRL